MKRIDPVLTQRARTMRSDLSVAETRLWVRLRGGQMGVRFTRQLPVGPYILDFAVRSVKLAIEIDGERHGEAVEYDRQRSEWLMARGWEVLRFGAAETLQDSEAVARTIAGVLAGKTQVDVLMAGHPAHPSPPRQGGDDSRQRARGGSNR